MPWQRCCRVVNKFQSDRIKTYKYISRPREFARYCGKASCGLENRGPLALEVIVWHTKTLHFCWCTVRFTLLWRHNGRDCVSNHQPHDCLLNRLFRSRSQKTSKLRVTGLCVQGIHRWPVNSPHKRPVTRKMFLFDDVITIYVFIMGFAARSDHICYNPIILIYYRTVQALLCFVTHFASYWENSGDMATYYNGQTIIPKSWSVMDEI